MASVPLRAPLLPLAASCFRLLQGPYRVRGKDGEAFRFSCRRLSFSPGPAGQSYTPASVQKPALPWGGFTPFY